jgi:shikimate dehydrogenase
MPCIDTATRLCAVIGNPVEHSRSPLIHNTAFAATGLNYVYVAFRVEEVAPVLEGMRALETFRGMSVTIPHKTAVMPHLDEIDALARHIGCVNTITNEDGRLLGTNTDGLGVLRAFDDAGVAVQNKRVLFLGSGGAVRAVAFAIAERKPAAITLLGRTAANVDALATDLRNATGVAIETGPIEDALEAAMASADIVIQGTPAGMYPGNIGMSLVPPALLRRDQVVFDMVYNPMKTKLLQDAEAAGAQTILGLEMLVNQAVLQFEIWTGMPAPYTAMRDALVQNLTR